ncbi:MAG: phosphohistidine phosphatase [Solirubrobacteraceae bacterium]|nr:phosphohistidine phosphatase [Solirubrobacteraceae bacterium]
MAAQLWLLRHGEAVPHAADDDSRDLTPRGEEQAAVAGRALAALELVFQAVYTSPKVRARRTAELACAALGVEPIAHEPLRGGFDARDARELMTVDQRILVVGHNPDLAQVVGDLTGARIELKKGGVAGLHERELLALLRPRELVRIASG